MTHPITPGKLLREARLKRKLTQLDIALQLNVKCQIVSAWECDVCNPPAKTLVTLKKLTGLSLTEMVKLMGAQYQQKLIAKIKTELNKKDK